MPHLLGIEPLSGQVNKTESLLFARHNWYISKVLMTHILMKIRISTGVVLFICLFVTINMNLFIYEFLSETNLLGSISHLFS